MSGPEFVVGAVSRAGSKALSASAAEEESLARIAEGTPEMRAAAKAYAQRLAIKQAALLKLYRPLQRLVGIQQEYFASEFGTDMAERIKDIPDEALQTPPASIAGPAMQGLGYSLDEPDLKEMYLNLLATATDGRISENAHPAFAELIKQLSAEEAGVLLDVLSACPAPMVEVRITTQGENGYHVLYPYLLGLIDHVTNEWIGSSDRLPMWIDNWVRLGLVQARFDVSLTRPSAYSWCDRHPGVAIVKEDLDEKGGVSFANGILSLTTLGGRFLKAVGPKESGEPAFVAADSPDASD